MSLNLHMYHRMNRFMTMAEESLRKGDEEQAELYNQFAQEIREEYSLPSHPVVQDFLEVIRLVDELYEVKPEVAKEIEENLAEAVATLRSDLGNARDSIGSFHTEWDQWDSQSLTGFSLE